jgi:ABC-type antimicrobial peptide transport system permease subunit
MNALVEHSAARQRFAMLMPVLFAGMALLLGVVRIYSVISYAVAQRQREIGIRMALGASPSDARRMVLREGLLASYLPARRATRVDPTTALRAD